MSDDQLEIDQKKAEAAAMLAKDDLRFVLGSPQGKRTINRLLERAGIFRLSADNSGSWTYFNEGRRSVGLDLIADIELIGPEVLLTVMKEGKKNG